MLIGELAKESGLSKDTIRFYEKLGILKAAVRRAGSRIYKEFDQTTIERLRLIKATQKLDFTLREIKQLSNDWENESAIPPSEKAEIIKAKIAELDAKEQQIIEIKQYLINKLCYLENSNAPLSENTEMDY